VFCISIVEVFINLIANAIKYSPINDTVDVSVSKVADEVLIAIKDHGIGIEQKDQQKYLNVFLG